jgi:hypothetical protein
MAYIRIACDLPSGKCIVYDCALNVTGFFFVCVNSDGFFVTNNVPESVHYVLACTQCYTSFVTDVPESAHYVLAPTRCYASFVTLDVPESAHYVLAHT